MEPGPARGENATARPLAAGLRTLTPAQYDASVRAVLELDVHFPLPSVSGQTSEVAAAASGISDRAVVGYERAAEEIARAVMADTEARERLLRGCEPAARADDACVASVVARVGRRAYRRELGPEEMARWASVAARIATELDDPRAGLELVLAGLLQSPSFLYRVELADPLHRSDVAPSAMGSDALATRLAYFLWDGPPDDALLDAARRGDLNDRARFDAILDRMLADERVRRGVRAFVSDLFSVSALSCQDGCPGRLRDLSPLAPQVLATAVDALEDGGFRGLFTTRSVWIDAATAELYAHPDLDVDPMAITEPVRVTLPPTHPRVGVLLTPGVMAMHANADRTSPAGRGLFVLTRFLCGSVDPPPPGVSTELSIRDAGPMTTRQLVEEHVRPACLGCHARIDPIGLGLEHFDAHGAWRETDTEAALPIDASGELDGMAFDDAAGLSAAIAEHPELELCLTSHVYTRATGGTVSHHAREIREVVREAHGDMHETMRGVARLDAFRYAWGDPR